MLAATLSAALPIGLAAAVLWSTPRPPLGIDDDRTPAVTQAVFANDQLWLLLANGRLVTIGPGLRPPGTVTLPRPAIGLCQMRGEPTVLILTADKRQWRLLSRTAGRGIEGGMVPVGQEQLVALGCDDRQAAIVTDRRLIRVENRVAHISALTQAIEPPLVRASTLIDHASVWVGLNNGEWGGGLIRIGRTSGAVTSIASNETGTLCGGPLNTDCDPVNAIVRSPSRPSCVLAAVGLVHMMSHGRLVEVCGDRVRRAYYRALDPQPPHPPEGADEPASTVAFTDMVRLGDEVWVVGIDGLYRFPSTGLVSVRPLPKFEAHGSYSIAYPDPHLALVLTGANGVASVSGALPLMVAR